MQGTTIIGHVPWKISAACSLFLRQKGTIQCSITGTQMYSADLPQGGLEVPCVLKFNGEPQYVAKVKKLLTPSNDDDDDIQQANKKRRIEPDTIIVEEMELKNYDPAKLWLSLNHLDLTEADRDIITSGEKLNDKHINFAQEILKRQFRKLQGLQSTLCLSKLRAPLPATGTLQIIHSRGNHWIVASTVACSAGEVMVYDSLYSGLDQPTMELILQLFGSDVIVSLHSNLVAKTVEYLRLLCVHL